MLCLHEAGMMGAGTWGTDAEHAALAIKDRNAAVPAGDGDGEGSPVSHYCQLKALSTAFPVVSFV